MTKTQLIALMATLIWCAQRIAKSGDNGYLPEEDAVRVAERIFDTVKK